MKYIIGSRGSKLALWQANTVKAALEAAFPTAEFEIQIVKTVGDAVRDRPMREVGTTGIFTRELEAKLLSGEIQLAIHSMKDMPSTVPAGLSLVSVLKRADMRDVLIGKNGKTLEELPANAVVGTGSLRRKFQLLKLRPDLDIRDIRGNIDTRVQKLETEGFDAIVLAAAAMNRMELSEKVSMHFDEKTVIPAPTQGILGAEFLESRTDIREMLEALQDKNTEIAARCERAFLRILQVGCHMPVAAYCEVMDNTLKMSAMYGYEDGSKLQFAYAENTDPGALVSAVCAQIER